MLPSPTPRPSFDVLITKDEVTKALHEYLKRRGLSPTANSVEFHREWLVGFTGATVKCFTPEPKTDEKGLGPYRGDE